MGSFADSRYGNPFGGRACISAHDSQGYRLRMVDRQGRMVMDRTYPSFYEARTALVAHNGMWRETLAY